MCLDKVLSERKENKTNMENTILKTNALTKNYGHIKALDNVNLELKEKHIYGFIGRNGAGKSTFMKILTGLSYQTSGELSLMGETTEKGIREARNSVGAMIESPAIFKWYSIRMNVEIKRQLVGNPDRTATDRVLELVDLKSVEKRRAGTLSMGMKQRLGIAMALVGNPKLLVLDEPINGLDPQNIVALRKLLKKLNEEKDITIFISSHILNELYLLATDYIIINEGRIVETLTQEQLEDKCKKYICVRTDDAAKAVTVLDKLYEQGAYKVISDDTIRIFKTSQESARIAEAFMNAGIMLKELSFKEQSLEEYFVNVAGGDAK